MVFANKSNIIKNLIQNLQTRNHIKKYKAI